MGGVVGEMREMVQRAPALRQVNDSDVLEILRLQYKFLDSARLHHCKNCDEEEKQPLHERVDCKTVLYNFGHNRQDCAEEDTLEVFYQCAQCRPEYELCLSCLAALKILAADP